MQDANIPSNENSSEIAKPSSSAPDHRIYRIILIIEAVFALGLIIAIAITAIIKAIPPATTPAPTSPTQSASLSICSHGTKDEIANLVNNITKEEALGIITESYAEDSCLHSKFLPENLTLRSDESSYQFLYSYNYVSEVPDIAQDSTMRLSTESADDFIIDEITDYYVVVSVDPSKGTCGQSMFSCYRGISFDKKYLDHHERTEGNSRYDEIIFNDLSADFAELVLKILAAINVWNGPSLYDYYFEDLGDSFKFTGVYFGVGLDLDNLDEFSADNVPVAINIYEMGIIVNKTTGKLDYEKSSDGDGGYTHIIRSISLSEADLATIQTILYP